MSIEKLIHKIQTQINDLKQVLTSFEDETIHPSVSDCENLNKQLYALQESIAVYKYQKNNKEISPSFNIHAKISEKDPGADGHGELKKVHPELMTGTSEGTSRTSHNLPVEEDIEPKTKPLLVGINDKFRFINELFAQNGSEYNIVLEQLSNLPNWHETDIYLNSLKDVYGWKESNEVVKYFYAHMKKRFD
ncbi:MAG: hypothetical protein PSX36_06105 [bacterium]|nr:hypothetical protein [bacterium]